METVHIAGAGLGGMVAAINLARAGRSVRVLDAGRGIGGIRDYHPSTHGTPMDLDLLSSYTGLDIRSQVTPTDRIMKMGAWEDVYEYGEGKRDYVISMWGVERGPSETSIDAWLYGEAKKLGVKFEFSSFVKGPEDLPPGSIFATGLYPEMFDALEIPYEEIHGYYFRAKRPDKDRYVLGWLGDFANDYFYTVGLNGMYYGLIFQRGKMDYGSLLEVERLLKEREGEVYDEWRPFYCRVPVKSFRQPRLFHKGRILAGSLTGMMDPLALYGIHGALLSGKAAALAATDPDRARRDFAALTAYYQRAWVMRKVFDTIPPAARREIYRFSRDHLAEFLKRYVYYMRPVISFADRGIPGYPRGWITPNLKPHPEEERRAALYNRGLALLERLRPGRNIAAEVDEIKAVGAA